VIQISSELHAALNATANQPLDLYELQLASGTRYYSTEDITWNGHRYLPYVESRSAIKRCDGGEFDRVTVTLSNVDTALSQLLLGDDIEGQTIVIRKIDRSVASDSVVLFHGMMERPSRINEKTASIEAVEILGSIEHECPSRPFCLLCPWDFKSWECGYEGPETECNKSWARCSELENTAGYGGFRFIPHSGTYQYEEVEKKRFLLLFSRKKSKTITATYNSIDDTPYDVPIPIILGRVQIAGIVIQHADEGSTLKVLAALCLGPINSIFYVRANTTIVTDWTPHTGQRHQTADARFPNSYGYNLLAYCGITVPSDVRSVDSAPTITAVVLGLHVPRFDAQGRYIDYSWSDNPIWCTRRFMSMPLLEGGMGVPEELMDDAVHYQEAAYCDELIVNTTNDQKIYAPVDPPPSVVVGDNYQRYQSTGVDGTNPEVDGPYSTYEAGVDDDTSTTVTPVNVKRFTMNVAVAKQEKAVDILYKKLLPSFRGYITKSKEGKLQIRCERPVANSAVDEATAVNSDVVSTRPGEALRFNAGDLILIGALTAHAEVRQVLDRPADAQLRLTVRTEFAHDAGEIIHLVAQEFTDANIVGNLEYPLSDRQPSTNRVTIKYVDSPAGFESRELRVNDYEHQAKVHKVNNEDLDGSCIDNYFQAWRIGQWRLAKYRDLGKFISFTADIKASLLEIGDVIAVSAAEAGLQAVPFRVIEVSYEENDEVGVVGQLYSLGVYDDSAPRTSVAVPGIYNPITSSVAAAPKPTALTVELRTEVVGGVPCFRFHVQVTSGGGSTVGFVAQARYFSDAAAQTPISEFVGLTWSDPSTATFDTRWEPLSDVQEYARVRVAAQNADNQLSEWVESEILAKPASSGLVTGAAPAPPTSVVAVESSGERWADQNALVYTKVIVSVTLPQDSPAKWLTVWAPNYAGNGFDLVGKWYVGETIKFDRIVLKGGATWTVKVSAGNEHGDSDVVESASFQVAALADSSANGITGASLGSVVYGNGYEGVGTQRWWGLDHVRYTLPSADLNFWTSQLTVQKVDVNGNAAPDNEGIERVVVEQAGAGRVIDFPISYWTIPDPASAYRYFRFRLYTLSRNGNRVLQTTCWSGSAYVQVEVGATTGPSDVLEFRAGRSQGDGSFQSSMYWDDRRQRMLIDWACLAPADRSNWSGIQLWIHSPKGYSRAASIPLTEFTRTDDGDLYLYDTIAIEPDSIPDPAETWTLICASVDIYGQVSTDGNGNPSGATVALSTLSNAIYVSAFTAEAVYETSESGDLTFRLRGSWTNAVTPRYKGVRVIMQGWDAGDITVADALEGESAFASKTLAVPSSAKAVTLYAVPVYGDGTVGAVVAGTTPSVALVIQRTNGSAGVEYASLVTGFSAAVASPAYGTNGQGQRVLRVNLSWTNPSDAKYGGVALYVIWVDGRTYQISGVERGTSLQWSTPNFPSAAANATFYACSVDTNNRRNSYVEGTTPAATISIPAVPVDGTGQEYCQNISNFSVSVSYPSTADGTSRAVVTCSFTAPSDSRWGGVEIRTSNDGLEYVTRVKGSATKLTFEVPVGISYTTYNVMAVSYDVNGRLNTGVLAYTPYVNIGVGTSAGQLDLSKAKASTYDSNIFIIQDGKLKVWAIDGSLIVTGSVTSAKLNTTEISVGGGGSKPGKFGVYNASGTQIGFIGVESSYEGAWFKQFRAGGTGAGNAPLVCDSSGNFKLAMSNSGCQVTMDQSSSVGPLVVTHTSTGRRVWVSHSDTYGSGLYIDLGAAFVSPCGRFVITSDGAAFSLSPRTMHAASISGDSSAIHFNISVADLSRSLAVDIDRSSTSYLTLNNMGIKVDGTYEAQTVDIPYTKADASTGTLNFRRGLLVSYS
jgi:phage-related protein